MKLLAFNSVGRTAVVGATVERFGETLSTTTLSERPTYVRQRPTAGHLAGYFAS